MPYVRTFNYFNVRSTDYFSKAHRVVSPEASFLVSVVKLLNKPTKLKWEVAFEEGNSWDQMTGAWFEVTGGDINFPYRGDILLGNLINQQPFTGVRWFRIIPQDGQTGFNMSIIEFYSGSSINRIGLER